MGKIRPVLWLCFWVIAFSIFFEFGFSSFPHICLMERVLSIHCPFCGLTKAFEEMLAGHIINAFSVNPLSVILPSYFLLHTYYRMIDKLLNVRILNRVFVIIAFFNLIYLNY